MLSSSTASGLIDRARSRCDGKISKDGYEVETTVCFTSGGMYLVLRPANAGRTRGEL